MQRMCPHVPPKPIKPHLRRRGPRTRSLKHPARDSERRVRCDDLYARYPLGNFSALGCGDVALFAVEEIDVADLGAGDVGEGFGGAEMREERAVALEDVGFFCAGGDGSRGVGPRTGVFGGVGRGEVEGA